MAQALFINPRQDSKRQQPSERDIENDRRDRSERVAEKLRYEHGHKRRVYMNRRGFAHPPWFYGAALLLASGFVIAQGVLV